MKKTLSILFLTALPLFVAAQVEKSVEVTKEFVPSVAGAAKMAIEPDRTDTTALRPDIDYSITPLAMTTTFSTTPIRPATVTYWQFNRPEPFYLKLGAGWPGNTVADFYATTQNPGTGYLSAYINHEGRFQKNGDEVPVLNRCVTNSARMYNRVGVAAGKYLGRHTLEGEINYDNRYYHRYHENNFGGEQVLPKILYNEFGVMVRFGDDFTDLSRTNFNIALRGSLFGDGSDVPEGQFKARQTHLGVDFALARQFKKHTFRILAMYEHGAGARSISDYRQDIVKAGLRYGYTGNVVDIEIGADYYFDKIRGSEGRDASMMIPEEPSGELWYKAPGSSTDHYVIPALNLRIRLGSDFMVFAEIDGKLQDNSLRTLTRQNPYVVSGIWSGSSFPQLDIANPWTGKSTVDYNFRAGIRGGVGNGKFAYRLYAGYAIQDNRIFWVAQKFDSMDQPFAFTLRQGRLDTGTVCGEFEYRPVSGLLLDAAVSGCFYTDEVLYDKGIPSFRGSVGVRYTTKKVSFGVRAQMQDERKWSIVTSSDLRTKIVDTFVVPFTVDLSASVDWRITRGLSLFGEVRNIANMKLYEYPYYPEYGVNFTAGVKLSF